MVRGLIPYNSASVYISDFVVGLAKKLVRSIRKIKGDIAIIDNL